MDEQIIESINERLLNDPTNRELILEKLQFLRKFPEILIHNLDEFKGLNFEPFRDGCFNHFYHAWGIIDQLYKQDKKYNNFHISLNGKQVVEIWNISTKYSEMNPERFYYIGVVFGPQFSTKITNWITEKQKAGLVLKIQTTYSHWFHFPEAEDQFITKSLVGIEEACPICGGDDDLENCVAVRNGQCSHSFHRNCIQRWFSHCGRIICPICKQESLKN